MPKKFGKNDKKEAGRERKESQKQEKKSKEKNEAEDLYWEDKDKENRRKEERKQNKLEKQEDDKRRKEEKQGLERREEEELSKYKPQKKITKSEAKATRAKLLLQSIQREQREKEKKSKYIDLGGDEEEEGDVGIPVNLNHLRREQAAEESKEGFEHFSAHGVEETMEVLGGGREPDRHPERRARVAFKEFEDVRYLELRAEFPGMKRRQYINMIYKEWKKHPQNPMNQEHIQYNTKVEYVSGGNVAGIE